MTQLQSLLLFSLLLCSPLIIKGDGICYQVVTVTEKYASGVYCSAVNATCRGDAPGTAYFYNVDSSTALRWAVTESRCSNHVTHVTQYRFNPSTEQVFVNGKGSCDVEYLCAGSHNSFNCGWNDGSSSISIKRWYC